MTHKDALSKTSKPTTCAGELEYYGRLFSDDVHWSVYDCPTCGARVWTVSPDHWWNHDAKKRETA